MESLIRAQALAKAAEAPAATLKRRSFLQLSAAFGGGLVVPFYVSTLSGPAAAAEMKTGAAFTPNAFVHISGDNRISVIVPYVEMGQGTYTSLPMLVAEELDVPLTKIQVEHAPPNDKLYGNPLLGFQATGGSTTIRAAYTPWRQAGATARTMLVAAAASTWGVAPEACEAKNGDVVHGASGRKLSYGALASKAAAQAVPEKVALKDAAQFKLIGKPAPRTDTVAKSTGKAMFGIDTMLPGLQVASIVHAPVQGGKVAKVDDSKAKAVKGVTQVVVLDDLVAVVGKHMGATRKAVGLLDVSWDDGANKAFTTQSMVDELAAASKRDAVVAEKKGDVAQALAGAAQKVEAVYQIPLLAHATMEPLNCTVRLTKDKCELWLGSQVVTRAQAVAAKVTGLPLEAVVVHNQYLGGGFGRRLEVDMVEHAVRIAQKVDTPVKVVWSREEDVQHDIYRPYYYDVLRAGLDASGKPIAWSHRVVGSSILARWLPPAFQKGLDSDAVEAAYGPYTFPNLLVDYVRQEPAGVTTGWWRGVGVTHNAFMVEGFIDELAVAAKQDPVAYRKALLDAHPRARAVIELAAQKAGWGKKMPAGSGQGVSLAFGFGSYVAQVADVEVAPSGDVSVKRIVCVVDCGQPVNPDTVKAQMEGGAIFGLSAALWGEITFKDGRVEQSNFHNYQVVRMNQAPVVEVTVVDSREAPGGIGEVGTVCTGPAVVNAIFAATGKRLRSLPIKTDELKRA
jgi:CO/xanthine dehydrogenase Mo-binding subunit